MAAAGLRTRSLRACGYTLLEILLAIALCAVLAAIALPRWGALLPSYRLSSAAREIQSELQRAKARAASGNTDLRLIFAATNYAIERKDGAFWQSTGESRPLPEGIDIRSFTASRLGFTARGTPTPGTGGTVKLCNGDGGGKNIVVSSTGRVRICSPNSCNGTC